MVSGLVIGEGKTTDVFVTVRDGIYFVDPLLVI